VIINEAAARLFWPNEDPLGKHFTIGMTEEVKVYGKRPSREIVGVVGNVKTSRADRRLPTGDVHSRLPGSGTRHDLIVRGQSSTNSLIEGMRRAVESVDPEQPIRGAQSLEAAIARSVAPQRFVTTLFLLFGSLALLLAIVGIYGVMSYSVTQRTQEIGIRIALGAQGSDVMRLIVGQALVQALTGVAIGVGAALGLTRLMSSLLYSVSATDPATFIVIATCLTVVALLASYLPARRATKVDPMVTLRHE
jgi:putative ABC transport system permease protein